MGFNDVQNILSAQKIGLDAIVALVFSLVDVFHGRRHNNNVYIETDEGLQNFGMIGDVADDKAEVGVVLKFESEGPVFAFIAGIEEYVIIGDIPTRDFGAEGAGSTNHKNSFVDNGHKCIYENIINRTTK